jgi:hypothetical protein
MEFNYYLFKISPASGHDGVGGACPGPEIEPGTQ